MAPATAKAKAPASKPKGAKPAATAGEGAAEPAAKGPKRASNAYLFYVQAKRAEVKGEGVGGQWVWFVCLLRGISPAPTTLHSC